MHLNFLKPLRVIISLLLFFFTLFVFADFAALFSARVISAILYLQFVPSLLLFLKYGTFAASGFGKAPPPSTATVNGAVRTATAASASSRASA